ncbi:MAG TPA: hypothetical protein PKX93_02960 [bacterium]|nr:hypothetical protein [bacterium]
MRTLTADWSLSGDEGETWQEPRPLREAEHGGVSLLREELAMYASVTRYS